MFAAVFDGVASPGRAVVTGERGFVGGDPVCPRKLREKYPAPRPWRRSGAGQWNIFVPYSLRHVAKFLCNIHCGDRSLIAQRGSSRN